MGTSQARIDANRRNAKKSTGPRTAEGKKRSCLNAVTHGLRAETLVLGDENPQELEDRRAAWRACLQPGDDVERQLVDEAVVFTWFTDRARRAQAARINASIVNAGVVEGVDQEREAEALGNGSSPTGSGP